MTANLPAVIPHQVEIAAAQDAGNPAEAGPSLGRQKALNVVDELRPLTYRAARSLFPDMMAADAEAQPRAQARWMN